MGEHCFDLQASLRKEIYGFYRNRSVGFSVVQNANKAIKLEKLEQELLKDVAGQTGKRQVGSSWDRRRARLQVAV